MQTVTIRQTRGSDRVVTRVSQLVLTCVITTPVTLATTRVVRGALLLDVTSMLLPEALPATEIAHLLSSVDVPATVASLFVSRCDVDELGPVLVGVVREVPKPIVHILLTLCILLRRSGVVRQNASRVDRIGACLLLGDDRDSLHLVSDDINCLHLVDGLQLQGFVNLKIYGLFKQFKISIFYLNQFFLIKKIGC